MDTTELVICRDCKREFVADCRDLGTYFCDCRPRQKIDLEPIKKLAEVLAEKYRRGLHESVAKN